MLDDYTLENARHRTLFPKFPVMAVPYQLVGAADIPGFRTGFYAKFPDSDAVSAVGFNDEKTRAMVYIENYCGLLCAGGQFYLLEKNDGQWVRPKMGISRCMWES